MSGTTTRTVGGLPAVTTLPSGAEVVALIPDATVSGGKAARRAPASAFQGPQGAAGTPGTTGTTGASFLTGTGVPAASLGANGDSYTDGATGNIYQKANGAWTQLTGASLRGPTGATGPAGSGTGTAASDGIDPAALPAGTALAATDEGVIIQGGEVKRATLAAMSTASGLSPGALPVAATLAGANELMLAQAGEVTRLTLDALATYLQGRIGTSGGTGGTGGGTTAAYVGPLDSYTSGWTGLYSAARRLRSAYTGAALRVRRASDNAEQDIGFTGAGLLDTAALTGFVGAGGNGFVRTLYDQGGGARHAAMVETPRQPQIVASGAVVALGGRPAMRFSNASAEQGFNLVGLPAIGTSLFAAAVVAPGPQQYGRVLHLWPAGAAEAPLMMFAGAEFESVRDRADGSSMIAKVYTLATDGSTPYVVDAEYTGAAATVHVAPANGLVFDEATAPFSDGFGAAGGDAWIGAHGFNDPAEGYNGLLAEVALSHAPSAGERANLVASMRAAFGIPA